MQTFWLVYLLIVLDSNHSGFMTYLTSFGNKAGVFSKLIKFTKWLQPFFNYYYEPKKQQEYV